MMRMALSMVMNTITKKVELRGKMMGVPPEATTRMTMIVEVKSVQNGCGKINR